MIKSSKAFLFITLLAFSSALKAEETNSSFPENNYQKPIDYAFLKPAYNYTLPETSQDISYDFLNYDFTSNQKICEAVRLVIDKSDRKLKVYYGSKLQKTFKITLGFNPVGDKVKRGDGKTPEGVYSISYKNLGSKYHKSFAINYPDKDDRLEAEAKGIDPGDHIMIHGAANEGKFFSRIKHFLGVDWTAGCISLRDSEIDQLWEVVDVGTLVEIKP